MAILKCMCRCRYNLNKFIEKSRTCAASNPVHYVQLWFSLPLCQWKWNPIHCPFFGVRSHLRSGQPRSWINTTISVTIRNILCMSRFKSWFREAAQRFRNLPSKFSIVILVIPVTHWFFCRCFVVCHFDINWKNVQGPVKILLTLELHLS